MQALPSLQSSSLSPVQTPPLQIWLSVQALPSSHAALLGEKTQPVLGSQPSSVQTWLSAQASLAPAVH